MKLRSDFRAAVLMKNRLHRESGEQVEKASPIQINKDDGVHLQARRGGTSLNGVESELIIFLIDQICFATVGFVYSRWRSTVTDGECRQIHFTRHFCHAVHTS